MCVKTRRVFVRVTERQHEYMMAKARQYDVSLSRLVLHAVEAYTRVYEDRPRDGCVVAINYSLWWKVDRDLGAIDRDLREVARQLAGVRQAILACRREGSVSSEALAVMVARATSVHRDMGQVGEDVAHCMELLDKVCEQTRIVDPYMGPMEGPPLPLEPTQEARDATDGRG